MSTFGKEGVLSERDAEWNDWVYFGGFENVNLRGKRSMAMTSFVILNTRPKHFQCFPSAGCLDGQ